MNKTPQWSGRVRDDVDKVRPAFLTHLLDEFKTCFGQKLGLDLTDESEEKHPVEVTLSSSDYVSIVSGNHPHIKEADLEAMYDEDSEDGPVQAVLTTARLQQLLEQYAIERQAELYDKRKTTIEVDHELIAEHAHSIFEAVHDYAHNGLIQWPKDKPLPSNEKVDEMIEMAWNEAIEMYHPKQKPIVRL